MKKYIAVFQCSLLVKNDNGNITRKLQFNTVNKYAWEGIKNKQRKKFNETCVCVFGMSSNSVLLNAKDRFFF